VLLAERNCAFKLNATDLADAVTWVNRHRAPGRVIPDNTNAVVR